MNITFCGAAKSVTGSCHLLECGGKNVLIDCGMRQGADAKSELGEGEFPFNPADIDAVLVTHAHIDHTGLLPLLVKRGFSGEIVATGATAELCSIMLPDSGHIQEQEAEYQNRKNERAGKPLVEPLYTAQDAANCIKQFQAVHYHGIIDILPGIQARFIDVGHLLGSAAIEVWMTENGKKAKIVFSGDLGRDDRPIISDPESITDTDYLVMEGTYGDRNHEVSTDEQKIQQFANVLKAALVRGGNIVIPSFAVGRTQELLLYIKRLLLDGTVPGLEKVPVYIDSPLGISATEIYSKCGKEYYDEEMQHFAMMGDTFDFPTLRIAQTSDESKAINDQKGSNIIISSSGMCDAGRIRHHLKHNLYRADSTVIFCGYQAQGTLGRILLDGAEKVKLFGEEIRVNATIERIEGFSGHAGRDELIRWVTEIPEKPNRIFLVHGESEVLESLRTAIVSLGYTVEIPELRESFDLLAGTASVPSSGEKRGLKQPLSERTAISSISSHSEAIVKQAKSIASMLDNLAVTPENEMKLQMMEKDIKLFVQKWHEFLS